ncbi:uncharacterized protein BDCG_17842 [Blastomyces dermatitidis ER-3]|uniref:Uncharacterized protein n=1 Tax=Ajellomyces dermatitidis (strain ER-3 / ATCC MYA-2586) TaxID=559297 RepID=A0ABX2W0M5_AJEDR|nr:uncharacterized protein BDCG_17842 [Blastomyces dermatitidis ER-3]OAT02936.1 hypothetical protein BDCG_17842 [Blastomyces dermatitidis ER-3]
MQCRQVVILVRDYIRAFSQREDEETAGFCRLNSAEAQAGLRHAIREKLQIELLRVTVLRIKLFSDFSLNDHTESYITVLTEGGGGVTTAVGETGNRLNMNELTGREDNTSLQDTVTTTTATREAGEGDVIMKAVLPRLSDTTVFTFNLAFLTATEAAAAS